MAVPFHVQGGKSVPAYVKNAKKRYNKAEAKANNVEDQIRNQFFQRKSQFISCKECKSKLNRNHLSSIFCPLCNASLFSDTNINRIKTLKSKVAEAINHLQNMTRRAASENRSGKIGYVVGGLCSS